MTTTIQFPPKDPSAKSSNPQIECLAQSVPFSSKRAEFHLQKLPDDEFWFRLPENRWLIAVITPGESRHFALYVRNHENAQQEFTELREDGWEVVEMDGVEVKDNDR